MEWLKQLLHEDPFTQQVDKMDPYQLLKLRSMPQFAKDQQMQNYLGPREHQQFMREMSQTDPVAATAALAAAPGYTGMKAMGMAPGGTGASLTSQPSLEELIRALRGYMAGQGK